MSAAFNYAGLATTAKTLIDRFGRSVTLRRRGLPVPDAAKPWAPSAVATVAGADHITVTAVEVGQIERETRDSAVADSGSRWIVAGSDLSSADLGVEWEVIDGARCVAIDEIRPIQPGATVLAYEMRSAINDRVSRA